MATVCGMTLAMMVGTTVGTGVAVIGKTSGKTRLQEV
jgi:hypothetical protein